jgi:DNA sulfur modification protein DndC
VSKRINYIISEIKDQYLSDEPLRPWIIGFSGGKDSTALLQLVWLAIKQISRVERQREREMGRIYRTNNQEYNNQIVQIV